MQENTNSEVRDAVFLAGGIALVAFGAGLILAHPAIRQHPAGRRRSAQFAGRRLRWGSAGCRALLEIESHVRCGTRLRMPAWLLSFRAQSFCTSGLVRSRFESMRYRWTLRKADSQFKRSLGRSFGPRAQSDVCNSHVYRRDSLRGRGAWPTRRSD